MSAILAVINKAGDEVPQHQFAAALASLRWRGRHREVVKIPHGWVAFVCNQEPEGSASCGADLAEDEHGNVAVCHGALYDAPDLYRSLGLPLPQDAHLHPAQAILDAYAKWGKDAPRRWTGEVSFVIWDNRQQVLVAGRDPMGSRPLFYYDHSGLTAFCTDSKALLTLGGRIPEPDPVSMHRFLCLNTYQDERTFFLRINRVLPGSLKLHRQGKLVGEEFWRFQDAPEVRLRTEEEYSERFQAVLVAALRRRMAACGEIGLDAKRDEFTQLIAALTGQIQQDELRKSSPGHSSPGHSSPGNSPLRSDSAVFISPAGSARFVPDIASLLGPAGKLDLLGALDRMNNFNDEPVASLSSLGSWLRRNSASNFGGRILLHNLGAEEILGQQLFSLSYLLTKGRWSELFDRLAQYPGMAQLDRKGRLVAFLHYALGPLVPDSLLDTRRSFRHKERFPWLNATLTRLPLERSNLATGDFASPVHRQMAVSLRHGYTSLKLHYEDRQSGILGIESRYPFLDPEVVGFCFGLPADVLAGDHSLAAKLRLAYPRLVTQGKRPAAVTMAQQLEAYWDEPGFQQGVAESLADAQLVADGWLRADKLQQLLSRVMTRDPVYRRHLWRVLALEGWYRQRWSAQNLIADRPALRLAVEKFEQSG